MTYSVHCTSAVFVLQTCNLFEKNEKRIENGERVFSLSNCYDYSYVIEWKTRRVEHLLLLLSLQKKFRSCPIDPKNRLLKHLRKRTQRELTSAPGADVVRLSSPIVLCCFKSDSTKVSAAIDAVLSEVHISVQRNNSMCFHVSLFSMPRSTGSHTDVDRR
jgi:hypothetical protein